MDKALKQPEENQLSQGYNRLERRIELFRSRVLYKSIDAAMTAVLRSEQTTSTYFKSVVHPRSSNYERVSAAVNLINRLLPGASLRISNRLCVPDRVPFAFQDLRLLSYGSGVSVFLVRRAEGLSVLKVYRRSLGRSMKGLLEVAKEFQEKHATLSAWYNRDFQLVSPAWFLILNGPTLGRPAAALLQPYISGEKKDLFQDFSDAEIYQLMQRDQHLCEQFCFFAHQTLQVHDQQGRCFDFIGRDNLLLTKDETGYRFVIIDNGIFDLAKIQALAPGLYTQLQAYISRLRNLLSALEQSS